MHHDPTSPGREPGDGARRRAAGGGLKRGYVHGTTDALGHWVVENPVPVHDRHARILHLLEVDHQRLAFRHAGYDFRLTDVRGRGVEALLA